MKVYTVTNQKGGSAKTTTAEALADLFAGEGKKVLRIDLDAQGNLSDTLRAKQTGRTAYEVLKGSSSLAEAIQTTARGDILPASYRLAALGSDTAPDSLARALRTVSDNYDVCVIDTPPALSIITVNALKASTSVIVTSSPDAFSLKGLKRIAEIIADLKKNGSPELRLEGILLTRYNRRAKVDQDMLSVAGSLAASLGTKVFNTQIRTAAAVPKAQLRGESLFLADPKSTAAEDYKAFFEEIKAEK